MTDKLNEVAQALYAHDSEEHWLRWDLISDRAREPWLEKARVAIAAMSACKQEDQP